MVCRPLASRAGEYPLASRAGEYLGGDKCLLSSLSLKSLLPK